jgi:hypothetical protein
MTRPLRCQLCGREAVDVAVSLVRWREAVRENEWYGQVARCRDAEACWERCTDVGDTWPVDDRRPATRIVLA